MSTINYYYEGGESCKRFQKDLPRGLSVLHEAGRAVQGLVITESPIDALSHRQVKLEEAGEDAVARQRVAETVYLSTCGTLSKGIEEELGVWLQRAKEEGYAVSLAFDNDRAGRAITRRLSKRLEAQGQHFSVESAPVCKDWNAYLQHKGMCEEKGRIPREVRKAMPLCLQQLGISPETVKGLPGLAMKGDAVQFSMYGEGGFEGQGVGQHTIKQDKQGKLSATASEEAAKGVSILNSQSYTGRLIITEHPLEGVLHRQGLVTALHAAEERWFAYRREEQGLLAQASQGGAVDQKALLEVGDSLQSAQKEEKRLRKELEGTMYIGLCGQVTAEKRLALEKALEDSCAKRHQITLMLGEESRGIVSGLLAARKYAHNVAPSLGPAWLAALGDMGHALQVPSQEEGVEEEEEREKKKPKRRGYARF